VRRFSPRVVYAGAALSLVAGLAGLGMSGHGLPALGMELRSGQAWLANVANHSISFVDGYSGEVVSQVSDPGGTGQVIDTPEGAVVVGKNGHLITVSNDDFSTSGSVQLFGGGPVTAAGGGSNTLYAVNEAGGEIQQLNPSNPELPALGPVVYVGAPIVSPVVAPDGSLYVGIPRTGSVGHVMRDRLTTIRGIAPPGARLAVVLAGTQPVAADLDSGAVLPLGAVSVIGRGVTLPPSLRPVAELVGSDSINGLVGAVGSDRLASANVTTGAVTSTPLPSWFHPTAAAMQGVSMVLIDQAIRDMLYVNMAHKTSHTLTMPGPLPPDQVTVQDGLFFINSTDGPDALVINGSGQEKPVVKYTTPPPHPKPAVLPAPPVTRVKPSPGPPKPPGAPVDPRALGGDGFAMVSWGAAPANGSPIQRYQLSWTGNGKSGSLSLPGDTGGKEVAGLSDGTSYVFTIKAQNALGWGPAAQAAPVTPSSKTPAAPAGVTAAVSADDGSVSLSWTEPGNGDQIQSYTVTEVGTGQQVATGVTGTSTVISGVVTAGSASFGSVSFTVMAVDTNNNVSSPSAPSNAVTPYLPPLTPTVTVSGYTQDGTGATLTVSCPQTTCFLGSVQSYTVTVNGATQTATAAADGAATQVTLTGLAANTSYTAVVTAQDAQQKSGPAAQVSLTTMGPPVVSSVAVSAVTVGVGAGAEVDVTATVNPGGEPLSSCTVTITLSSGGSGSGACGAAVTIGVPMYNTSYTATVTAKNNDGTGTGTGTGTSSLKELTANASTAFGAGCPNIYGGTGNCGPNSSAFPSDESLSNPAPISAGTEIAAKCWATGLGISGADAAYPSGTNYYDWIELSSPDGGDYMSELYFPDPPGVTAGLPSC